jgi:S-adenosylmethionine uptake transporter
MTVAGMHYMVGGSTLAGVGLAVAGYAVFSLQDAAVKWLVADYTVWQILFVRSVTITTITITIARRSGLGRALRSPNKPALLLRACVILGAWLCYYNAARDLGLADLTTLYYAAPLFVTVLSILLLGERVTMARWAAVGLGFIGVVVAANPAGRPDLMPAVLVLTAALLWAWSNILIRQIISVESTLNQMLFSNGAFLLVCGATMPWMWRAPDVEGLSLMIGLGVASGLGQYLLFESFRRAPASVIAPCEYTGLIWAFLLGFLVWGDVPTVAVFVGAGVIVAASLLIVLSEGRRGRVRPPIRPAVAHGDAAQCDGKAFNE